MDFSQHLFWTMLLASLPILLLGNLICKQHAVHRRAFQQVYIIVLSLSMLGASSVETLVIFMCVTMAAYFACLTASRYSLPCRKLILCVLIPLLFAPLLYYKYGYFIGDSLLGREWNTLKDLVIPIGLSFYSFQTVGFCVDSLLRNMPVPHWREYMVFCSFFPQIVAGPIERREDLLPQVQRMDFSLSSRCLNIGIRYILLGLFFKMFLADNIALAFKSSYQGESAWVVWLNNVLFSCRIYFDFAGYGLTAYGFARCLGIRLQMNFMSPYTATDIGRFWRCWHRSLTGWFRDYIYFPLGGSRTRFWAVNMMLVFLVSGLWHGAGWNFVIWGGLSGLAIVLHRFWRRVLNVPAMPAVPGWGLTMVYMVLIWMFFYDTDMPMLMRHCSLVFSPAHYSYDCLHASQLADPIDWKMGFPFLLAAVVTIALEWYSSRNGKFPYGFFLRDVPCAVMLFLIIFFAPSRASQFIYFVF